MHKGVNTTCDEGQTMIPVAGGGFDVAASREIAPSLTSNYGKQADSSDTALGPMLVTHSLRADGFDASEDGTGRGTPLVPVAFNCDARGDELTGSDIPAALTRSQRSAVCFSAKDHGADAGELAPTLRAGGHRNSHANAGVMPAVAFAQNQRDEVRQMDVAGALASEPGMKRQTYLQQSSAVRRLTPEECEKLQGFEPGYTRIPYRGKPAADGPRYKALGNSMAVPVMAWVGQRIALVEALVVTESNTAAEAA